MRQKEPRSLCIIYLLFKKPLIFLNACLFYLTSRTFKKKLKIKCFGFKGKMKKRKEDCLFILSDKSYKFMIFLLNAMYTIYKIIRTKLHNSKIEKAARR